MNLSSLVIASVLWSGVTVSVFAQVPQKVNLPATNPSTVAKTQTSAQTLPKSDMTAVHADTPVESLLSEDLIKSLRDPFQIPSSFLVKKEVPKTDLEIFPLKDFKLNGVITGPKKTRAMVSTPNNKVFFVRVGDRIGVREGKVTQINPEAIRVTEYFSDEHGKRVPDVYEITLEGDLVSLTKKEE